MSAPFREGDRLYYVGPEHRLRYVRGTVAGVEGHEYHLAGVRCYELVTAIVIDGGDHTICSSTPESEWRALDPIERLAELADA